MFTNYVEIIKKDVVDKHGRLIARPHDFLVQIGGAYPHFSVLILARGFHKKEFATIPWSQVRRIDGAIHLNVAEELLRWESKYVAEPLTSIKKSILDKQVVDTFNRKVIRVNDLHILKVDKDLRLAHVDVGLRSLLRRLGWERWVDSFVRTFFSRARYLSREQFIAWKFVQPLEVEKRGGTLQLNVSHEDLASIPPGDFSEIMDELDPPERIALFRSLDFETQVDVLNELEVDMQRDLIEELDRANAIRLMEKMEPDEVADLLGALSKQEVRRILSLMSPVQARKLRSLLKYESDSAGGLMTTDFILLKPETTIQESLDKIRKSELDIEMICYAAVSNADGYLVGYLTLKELLHGNPEDRVEMVMMDRPISVSVNDSVKEVAFLMDKYDFLAIPVVDDENVVRGMISIDDILAFAVDEAWGEKPGLL